MQRPFGWGDSAVPTYCSSRFFLLSRSPSADLSAAAIQSEANRSPGSARAPVSLGADKQPSFRPPPGCYPMVGTSPFAWRPGRLEPSHSVAAANGWREEPNDRPRSSHHLARSWSAATLRTPRSSGRDRRCLRAQAANVGLLTPLRLVADGFAGKRPVLVVGDYAVRPFHRSSVAVDGKRVLTEADPGYCIHLSTYRFAAATRPPVLPSAPVSLSQTSHWAACSPTMPTRKGWRISLPDVERTGLPLLKSHPCSTRWLDIPRNIPCRRRAAGRSSMIPFFEPIWTAVPCHRRESARARPS